MDDHQRAHLHAGGRKEGVCSACKQTVSRRIEMLPHEYGEMTVAVEPTCTQNGKGESFCAVCGRKKTETLAKLGHDWGEVSVTQEPTCAKKRQRRADFAPAAARRRRFPSIIWNMSTANTP